MGGAGEKYLEETVGLLAPLVQLSAPFRPDPSAPICTTAASPSHRLSVQLTCGPAHALLTGNTKLNTGLCGNLEAGVWSRFRVHLDPRAETDFR